MLISNHAKTVVNFVQLGGGLSVASGSPCATVAEGAIVVLPISDPGMDLRDIGSRPWPGATAGAAAHAFLNCSRSAYRSRSPYAGY